MGGEYHQKYSAIIVIIFQIDLLSAFTFHLIVNFKLGSDLFNGPDCKQDTFASYALPDVNVAEDVQRCREFRNQGGCTLCSRTVLLCPSSPSPQRAKVLALKVSIGKC